MANSTESDLEVYFRKELFKRYEVKKSVLLLREDYHKLIAELTAIDMSAKKTPHEYYLLKKYEVLKCADVLKLIRRRDANEDPVYFATLQDTYNIIKRAHIATGHGGRDKMVKELIKKYANITHDAVTLYKSLCIECQRKRPTTKGTVVRPIFSKNYGSRSQVDLGNFKWIMVYQDHLTKFCVLRPLASKRAAEVAYQLLDIFLLLGAPEILQSDNGSEFTAAVITELKLLWPDLVMVHGKPRHPQSQVSVERANCDIKDMLVAWLGDNQTTDWTVGLKCVQFQKNSSYHSGIKMSPFAALFGSDAKVGLTTSALSHDIIHRLQSEDDLLAIVTDEPAAEPFSDVSVSPTVEATSATTEEPTSVEPTSDPESPLSVRHNNITFQRKRACEAQLLQAERMVKRSRRIMDRGNVGNNVTVPIPMVDRGRGDPRNIMGMIMDIDENDNYTIAVKCGILSGKYTRNQFDLCTYELYSTDDVNTEKIVSLRSAVQQESKSGGQGFAKEYTNRTSMASGSYAPRSPTSMELASEIEQDSAPRMTRARTFDLIDKEEPPIKKTRTTASQQHSEVMGLLQQIVSSLQELKAKIKQNQVISLKTQPIPSVPILSTSSSLFTIGSRPQATPTVPSEAEPPSRLSMNTPLGKGNL
ncbi:KRAB-A domain-containing protein 2 [Nymphon striatum]|nr:KRAB-A domain-containing protein 2 [Nymphon striatum]